MTSSINSLPPEVDAVIIGGGIVGSASALTMADRGLRVLLIEKDKIAAEQSGRNWGFVRQQGRDPAELPLMIASNHLWRRMSQELGQDIEWKQGGNLALTTDAKTAAAYEEWVKLGHTFGLDTEIIGMDRIRRLLPGVAGSWEIGLFTPSDGHADPVKATRALANSARQRGARVVTGCTVTGITTAGGAVVGVETDRGSVGSRIVVCAAGMWSRPLLSTVGLDLPQRVVRSTVALTEPAPSLANPAVWSAQLSFRQSVSGSFVISLGGRGDVDLTVDSFRQLRYFLPMYIRNRRRFRIHLGRHSLASLRPNRASRRFIISEPTPNQADVELSRQRLATMFPQLAGLSVKGAWAGRIDGTPDALPVIDTLNDPRGLIVATGFSGHGFAMGPIVGRVVADLVCTGSSEFDLRSMRFWRFRDGTYGKPKSLL